MAIKQIKTVYGASPALNEKVQAARLAVHETADLYGLTDFHVPSHAFLDHRDAAKEMHSRWVQAKADLTKKGLTEGGSIACYLQYTDKGLAFEFSATTGKSNPNATAAVERPKFEAARLQTLDIFLFVQASPAASFAGMNVRDRIVMVAEQNGLDGFRFPIERLELEPNLAGDRVKVVHPHADHVYRSLGFARAPREPGLFIREGALVWQFQGHTEVEPSVPHAAESAPPFMGLQVKRR